jgi:catechol 2,3-dioxygenase-like lactoylglutathione lyase family enzyme
MVQARGVHEVAIRVRDLARSEAFYRSLLGAATGARDEDHHRVFLGAAGRRAMIVLQEDKGDWRAQRHKFAVGERDIDRAAALLRELGITARGPVIDERGTRKSLHVDDPDGNSLDFYAPLNVR